MKNILTNTNTNYSCTGCAACGVICPTDAISCDVSPDGFYTPSIDENKCINCGLCVSVCYKYFNPKKLTHSPYQDCKVIAVLNNYVEEMHTVTTAGVATVLSKYFIENKYNIVGVDFDPVSNICKHEIAQDHSDILRFKKSKYVQSQSMPAFRSIVKKPKAKNLVFGTPCQIYGLRKVLQKRKLEDKFILVDLFCAGVPSLNLWKSYKDFLERTFHIGDVLEVNFRDKSQGWHKFSMSIRGSHANYKQNLYNDMYFRFYLNKWCSNRACYDCIFRHRYVASDIRLGDFWGSKYQQFDDGIELVTIHTTRGEQTWDMVKHLFRYEYCDAPDIKVAQKFDKIQMPDVYEKVMDKLARGIDLEKIFQ